jgi:hypothetical protein
MQLNGSDVLLKASDLWNDRYSKLPRGISIGNIDNAIPQKLADLLPKDNSLWNDRYSKRLKNYSIANIYYAIAPKGLDL